MAKNIFIHFNIARASLPRAAGKFKMLRKIDPLGLMRRVARFFRAEKAGETPKEGGSQT
jgi:hypothetical protein